MAWLCASALAAAATGLGSIATETFDLDWHTMDPGGGASAGNSFDIIGVVGQPDAGVMLSGDTFDIVGGFWSAPGNGSSSSCAADIAPAGGNGVVDVDDMLTVLNHWGAVGAPGSSIADIAPPGGNGQVNVDDLLLVITMWGTCH